MDVSQFELVYKPQSPAGPADTVLQGYFLEITNLEAVDLQFSVRLTTSSISDPDRSLFANAVAFVDTPSTNQSGPRTLSGNLTSASRLVNGRVSVPAKGTALVAILPSDPFGIGMAPVPPGSADFECRGYVTLTLPTVFQVVQGPSFPLFSIKQQFGGQPARVLLTAQNRANYTDPSTGAVKGQTQASVPITTGQSLNEIVPDPVFLQPQAPVQLGAIDPSIFEDVDMTQMLATMLATASAADLDLRAFNASLKEAGIGMAVETRKLPAAKGKAQLEDA